MIRYSIAISMVCAPMLMHLLRTSRHILHVISISQYSGGKLINDSGKWVKSELSDEKNGQLQFSKRTAPIYFLEPSVFMKQNVSQKRLFYLIFGNERMMRW